MRWTVSIACLTLIGLWTGCVPPVQVQTQKAPSLKACDFKTYAIDLPEDLTPRKWLSTPSNRQALETILVNQMSKVGLQQVAAASEPPMILHYVLFARDEAANVESGSTIIASDFVFGQLTVTLADTKTSTSVWTTQVKLVVGSLQDQNLERIRNALAESFGAFPVCPK